MNRRFLPKRRTSDNSAFQNKGGWHLHSYALAMIGLIAHCKGDRDRQKKETDSRCCRWQHSRLTEKVALQNRQTVFK